MDHAPVLAITGMQHSDLIGTLTQQDVAKLSVKKGKLMSVPEVRINFVKRAQLFANV
jgi:hypothetical protein